MADDAHDELRVAAELAQSFLARVSGQGGIAEQVSSGEWNAHLDEQDARDLAALLRAMGETVRYTRAQAHLFRASDGAPSAGPLPINRKERYYTGTVLPMLVASDGFAHLDRFLRLCGLPAVDIAPGLEGDQTFQFLTEYGFAESVFTEVDKSNWPGPLEADTPDIVLAGTDWRSKQRCSTIRMPQISRRRCAAKRSSLTCGAHVSVCLPTGSGMSSCSHRDSPSASRPLPTPSSHGSRCSTSTTWWVRATGPNCWPRRCPDTRRWNLRTK
jgi:hypothetical protein